MSENCPCCGHLVRSVGSMAGTRYIALQQFFEPIEPEVLAEGWASPWSITAYASLSPECSSLTLFREPHYGDYLLVRVVAAAERAEE